MKLFFRKFITFSGVLAFLLSYNVVFAQLYQPQIQSVSWQLQAPNPFSILGEGVLNTNPNPDPFNWKIEWGFAGVLNQNPDGSISPSGINDPSCSSTFVPSSGSQYLGMSNLSSLNPTQNSQYLFMIPLVFQDRMWPASRYYMRIHEANQNGSQMVAILNSDTVIETPKIQNLNLNISNTTGGMIFNVGVPSVRNTANNLAAIHQMPIGLYILSQDASGILADNLDPSIILHASSSVLLSSVVSNNYFGNATFGTPITLGPGETIYLKFVNEQPCAGGMSLLQNDIQISLPEDPASDTPVVQTGGTSVNNTGIQVTTPGFTQPSSGSLVPCDETTVACNFEKLLELVNNVLNFFIFVIAIPIITLTFVYAGFLLITSGGNPSKKDDAKGIIGKAVTGLIIMLAAWLLIKTILIVLGYQGPLLGVLGV